MNNTHLLNVAEYCPSSETLGPGKRFVLWVQGCPFNCTNCTSPNWIPFEQANVMSIDAVAELIIAQPKLEGITISGGEPMMQAARLSRLIELVKWTRPELNVIVFTGFTKAQLVWQEANELLEHIDLLVDGQYVDQKNDGQGLRGSSNQNFYYLTDRLIEHQTQIEGARTEMELHVSRDGALMAGIPKSSFSW